MHIIKKYANRKLYHTNRKQYITLEGIAELIQAGEQVQVIDNETGDDISSTILAQVVLQVRGRKSLLPTHLLTSMIQSGGDTFAELRRSAWTALGGTEMVDSEIRRRLQWLHEHGRIDAADVLRIQHLLLSNGPVEHLDEQPAEVPNSKDVARLSAQVDALTAVVEQLLAEREQGK